MVVVLLGCRRRFPARTPFPSLPHCNGRTNERPSLPFLFVAFFRRLEGAQAPLQTVVLHTGTAVCVSRPGASALLHHPGEEELQAAVSTFPKHLTTGPSLHNSRHRHEAGPDG